MKKLEAWFENGIDDEALIDICKILINHDAKFYVTEERKGDPDCKFFRGGNCIHEYRKSDACVGNENDCCSVILEDKQLPAGPVKSIKIIEPWTLPNEFGEAPGGICCKRANGKVCFEHDKSNYVFIDNKWVTKGF